MSADVDVLIIGAGVAGISAAHALRSQGRSCVLLEALHRPGGRAFTDASGVDHGAAWLHQPDKNPLFDIAQSLSLESVNHDDLCKFLTFSRGTFVSDAEKLEIEKASDHFWQAMEVAAQEPKDRPVSEVMPRHSKWSQFIADWEGPLVYGTDLEHASLHDIVATSVDGGNLLLRDGLGTLVSRLAVSLPIHFGCSVTHLAWNDKKVVAKGAFGAVRANSAIVTVATGVLANHGIRFDPELPDQTQQAIQELPMGLVNKIVFMVPDEFADVLPPFSCLRRDRRFSSDAPMAWIARPFGKPHLIGFLGGDSAWELSRAGLAAMEAHARAELSLIFGAREVQKLGTPVLTNWGADASFHGSYSYARPGGHLSRKILAEPLGDGRLVFAGEASHARFASTVAGAWLSGAKAALDVRPGSVQSASKQLGRQSRLSSDKSDFRR